MDENQGVFLFALKAAIEA